MYTHLCVVLGRGCVLGTPWCVCGPGDAEEVGAWSMWSLPFPRGWMGPGGFIQGHGLKGTWAWTSSVAGGLCACQCYQGGEGAGVTPGGSQKTNRAASLPFPLVAPGPPPGQQPNCQDTGSRGAPGRYGAPNMVSVIQMITADICRGFAMCQALCQRFLTPSWPAPQ